MNKEKEKSLFVLSDMLIDSAQADCERLEAIRKIIFQGSRLSSQDTDGMAATLRNMIDEFGSVIVKAQVLQEDLARLNEKPNVTTS